MSRSSTSNISGKAAPHDAEFEVREDEEQSVKLSQIIELLLAAGYFRVRIKGLSPFDKVVGGMVWCISVCSYDVDIDLLFQENSSIGQRIAMTEKIVGALKYMKCPHRIEPHQIQGLDFIHIFPIVQWLVKRAIETRVETGDYIRAFSISQFNKTRLLPQDIAFNRMKLHAIEAVTAVQTTYRPRRKYRWNDSGGILDEETRVQTTLLEYGRQSLLRSSADSTVAVKTAGTPSAADLEQIRQDEEREEKSIESLMSAMSLTSRQEGKLTAGGVGLLVGLQSEHIQSIAARYADKQQTEASSLERTVGGVQHQQRAVAALRKQSDQQTAKLQQAKQKHAEIKSEFVKMKEQIQELENAASGLDEQLTQLEEQEELADKGVLVQLRSLVAMHEKLKKQETEFRDSCKQEKERLEASIAEISDMESRQHKEHAQLIEQQYAADRRKLNKIRLLLAKRNQETASLQRKIDEVPSRAELSQYQKRFLELYNLVAAKHKETKQFYTLYNTLDDTKVYLEKEVNLLNSINDNFEQAMASAAGREQFLKQFEQIVEGVKQNRIKVERRKQEEKMKRDQLNDINMEFVDKQRLYFKTVKDFQEECRRNEILNSKHSQS